MAKTICGKQYLLKGHSRTCLEPRNHDRSCGKVAADKLKAENRAKKQKAKEAKETEKNIEKTEEANA